MSERNGYAGIDDFVVRKDDGEPTTVDRTIERIDGKKQDIRIVPPNKGTVARIQDMDNVEVEQEGMREALLHMPDFREQDRDGEYYIPDEKIDNIPNIELERLFKAFMSAATDVSQEQVEQVQQQALSVDSGK